MVDAMTALRSCVLWSDADSVPHVAIVAICVRPTHSSPWLSFEKPGRTPGQAADLPGGRNNSGFSELDVAAGRSHDPCRGPVARCDPADTAFQVM
jgi:hypothetical protein